MIPLIQVTGDWQIDGCLAVTNETPDKEPTECGMGGCQLGRDNLCYAESAPKDICLMAVAKWEHFLVTADTREEATGER